MKLELVVHTALDELRMQMLGTEVLFGFQLRGAFQEGFSRLGVAERWVAAVALSLIVVTLGFLLAAPSQHRLVEKGRATIRVMRVANRFAEWALATFGIAIGADCYVVLEPYAGRAEAAGVGVAVAAMALLFWYGTGPLVKAILPPKLREIAMPEDKPTSLHEKIDQMLTEARVVLPGAQALLGFQFAVTMTRAFAQMDASDRAIHFCALVLIALAIMLLLTPATIHRIAFRGMDAERFHDIGSGFVTAALLPLAAAIALDFYIAVTQILQNNVLAVAGAIVAAVLLLGFWFLLPFYLRGKA